MRAMTAGAVTAGAVAVGAVAAGAMAGGADNIELSVVMPCLNESDTLEICIRKAAEGIAAAGIVGEILVADNGSSDGSPELARRMGARVVHVSAKGYGNALMGGIEAAQGRFIIMGDADDSYDFREIPRIVQKLREGYALVQGCRLPSGGGTVMPGAMPFLHRRWGNPMFSVMARSWFGAPVHDIYCGLRGFTKDLYLRLNQRCTGMEFATEMIIKSSLYREKIAEVPITLHPDGRKSHAPHLKTFRDGWRTLRFFLMYSPRWLFLTPGLLLTIMGLVGYAIALPGMKINGVEFDAHTLLFASLFLLCGYQTILFAIFTKTFAISQGLMPEDPRLNRFFKVMYLERGLGLGLGAMIAGCVMLLIAIIQWAQSGFGHLDYAHTMRFVVPGSTLTALGFQTILSSFFVSILGMKRKN
jgi:glycosyltransferase involved in cell wall biosynthesis